MCWDVDVGRLGRCPPTCPFSEGFGVTAAFSTLESLDELLVVVATDPGD